MGFVLGVNRGCWYWEATIEEMPEGTSARIGWGQDYGNLQAPLGYDKFGYSWRSKKGTRFHESIGKHYSSGFSEGDTVGFLIILPERPTTKYAPHTYKDRVSNLPSRRVKLTETPLPQPLVKFKSHLYYEDKDNVPERLKALQPLHGSKILFFKNGKCEGVAFQDIYQGSYYPSFSVYKNATVSVNFGPNFKHMPSEFNCRGVSFDRDRDSD